MKRLEDYIVELDKAEGHYLKLPGYFRAELARLQRDFGDYETALQTYETALQRDVANRGVSAIDGLQHSNAHCSLCFTSPLIGFIYKCKKCHVEEFTVCGACLRVQSSELQNEWKGWFDAPHIHEFMQIPDSLFLTLRGNRRRNRRALAAVLMMSKHRIRRTRVKRAQCGASIGLFGSLLRRWGDKFFIGLVITSIG